MEPNPLTKKALAQIKRESIQRAISACMHLLHDSYLPDTDLWPEYILAGWMPEKVNTIMVGARIDEISNDLIINNFTYNFDDTEAQMEAIKNILDQSIYEGVYFEFQGNTYSGPDNQARSNPGQSRFTFTLTH